MIQSEAEYEATLRALDGWQQAIRRQRDALIAAGLRPEEVERALEPMICFVLGIQEEAEAWERQRTCPVEPHHVDSGGAGAKQGDGPGDRLY